MKRVSVSITTNGVCGTEIIINGKALDGVKEFHFSQKAGELPQLSVSLLATDVVANGTEVYESNHLEKNGGCIDAI